MACSCVDTGHGRISHWSDGMDEKTMQNSLI